MQNSTILTEKQNRMIKNVLNEMVSTEVTYFRILSELVEAQATILEQSSAVLSNYDQILLQQGFDFINTMATMSERMLGNFEAIKASPFKDTPAKVAEFQRIIADMKKTYANYCVFYEIFQNKVSKTLAADNHIDVHQLSGLMAAPFQRQPRYAMLFNELLKNMPNTHPQKELYEQVLSTIRENATDINGAMDSYQNPAMLTSALDFGNDSQFRRQVKGALTSVLMNKRSEALTILLEEHKFSTQTRSKQFSNKRYFDILDADNNRLVSFVVNRHSLSIQLNRHYNDLHDVQKQALLKLQFLVCFDIENALGVNVDQDLKHKLNILGDIDFVTETSDLGEDLTSTPTVSFAESQPAKVYANPFSQEYKNTLMRLMTENKGLSRQGSFKTLNTIEQIDTSTESRRRVALPGMA